MTPKSSKNRNTRIALLQGLVPASIGDIDVIATREWLRDAGYLQDIDKKRFKRWFDDIVECLVDLDGAFEPFLLNRSVAELGQTERAILRIATYELTRTNVPSPVVINEWVDIAKDFGAENSFRFVNGVLDRVAAAERAKLESNE